MKIIFDELAKLEFEEASAYYKQEMPGLDQLFRDAIKSGLQRIRQYPEAWTVERGDVRRYLVHKFPYKILYSIEENYLYILAIAHCHRKPSYWIQRKTNKP